MHHKALRAAEARPDFEFEAFSQGGFLQFMVEHTRWAGIAARFIQSLP